MSDMDEKKTVNKTNITSFTKIWTTKDGVDIEINKMTDKHLINAYLYLYRRGHLDEAECDDLLQEMTARGIQIIRHIETKDMEKHLENRDDFLTDMEAWESVLRDEVWD